MADPAAVAASARPVGIPSSPRVTVASDPDDDIIFVTSSEGQVLLIEPRGVVNTGDTGGERTAKNDAWI